MEGGETFGVNMKWWRYYRIDDLGHQLIIEASYNGVPVDAVLSSHPDPLALPATRASRVC